MMAKLTIAQRIQVGLVLAIAFLLVLGSNRLDQRHFSNIQTTVNSVHNDRVVVQDFIYQLNNIFHKKELRFMLHGDIETGTSEGGKVQELLVDFAKTELTLKESKLLKELNDQFSRLQQSENIINESPGLATGENKMMAVKIFNEIEKNLNELSKIQLEESGQLTQLSKKSLGMNMLLSQLEVVFLIIVGIAMLALVLYPTLRAQALL